MPDIREMKDELRRIVDCIADVKDSVDCGKIADDIFAYLKLDASEEQRNEIIDIIFREMAELT